MSRSHSNTISRSQDPRHGHVFSPKSRAYLAWQAGDLDEGALNQRESGKFFPQTAGGLLDPYAPADVANFAPPPDGKIASANQLTGAMLDEPGSHWEKHKVRSGEILDVSWNFTANHPTRRWNYFLTREGWDPSKVLARDQFEPEPFYVVQNNQQPYWAHSSEMKPSSPTLHALPLPRRLGYQVLLCIWEVVDTGNSFIQVVDLDFLPPEGGGDRPDIPTGLSADTVTDKQVVLTWNVAAGPAPISFYRIERNGSTTVDVSAPLLTWTDNSVAPETQYNYTISAHDELGNFSSPSRPVQVHTLPEGGEERPTAPQNLHSMGQTQESISLMWGGSTGPAPIVNYLIYRDDVEIGRVSANQTTFNDTGLTPDTQYRYRVQARDLNGKLSSPSNILSVKTQGEVGEYPAWKLNTFYETNALVSHLGGIWRCLQKHTSYTTDWAPGQDSSEVLWVKYPSR